MERLRDAIAKARASRLEGAAEPARRPPIRAPQAARPAADTWPALRAIELDDGRLAEERIVSWKKSDPAHVAFDVLRTRLLRVLVANGWRKVLITSPSKGCGKTTVALNLAMSLSRQAAARTLMIDLDLRTPRVARRLGLDDDHLSIVDWLSSDEPPRSHVVRVGDNLAICPNNSPVENSAEVLHDVRTAQRLDAAITELDPAVVIYDTVPMLVSDDTLGFLPQVDCVLMVAGAGHTTAEQIEECERLLEGNSNFLGVLLNKCVLPPRTVYGHYLDNE